MNHLIVCDVDQGLENFHRTVLRRPRRHECDDSLEVGTAGFMALEFDGVHNPVASQHLQCLDPLFDTAGGIGLGRAGRSGL